MNSFNDKFIVYTGPTFPLLLNKDHALHLQFVLHGILQILQGHFCITMRIHIFLHS